MTAVGYGDMSGSTGLERVFCLFLMLTGVLIFGMVTGSLASIMTNQDSINATYTERLMFLNRLQLQYKLPNDLYAQIKKTL
jgi:voltage-gated potassium channel